MKAEIYANGPISCGIEITPTFDNYTGFEVYGEKLETPEINHEISILGYGVEDDGTEYWIGRNSWGNYWGEWGFFRLTMKEGYNLGVNLDCSAGIPTYDKPSSNDLKQETSDSQQDETKEETQEETQEETLII